MSENKLNVIVPKDYNGAPIEVVLREGEAPVALDPKEPERVVINGTIDAPFRWLEKRVELINQKSTNLIVNRDKMGLALTIDETNYYQTEINGILQASKEMMEFGINTDKKWEPIKLSKFIKMQPVPAGSSNHLKAVSPDNREVSLHSVPAPDILSHFGSS